MFLNSSVGFGSIKLNFNSILKFAFATHFCSLNSITCWPIMQKVRCFLPNCFNFAFSWSFHSRIQGFFSIFLHSTSSLSIKKSISAYLTVQTYSKRISRVPFYFYFFYILLLLDFTPHFLTLYIKNLNFLNSSLATTKSNLFWFIFL